MLSFLNFLFFLLGSIQGKFQPHGILGDCDDFLHRQSSQSVTFKMPPRDHNRLISLVRKQFRYDTPYAGQPFNLKCGGFWHAGKFRGFNFQNRNRGKSLIENKDLNSYNSKTVIPKPKYSNMYLTLKSSKKSEIMESSSSMNLKKQDHDKEQYFQTLKIYGDSMGRHFYESLAANHSLCRKMFKHCSLSYTWVYKMFNQTVDRYQGVHNYDNLDFNETRFLSDLKLDLTTPDMLCKRSVYVVNFGVHTIMTLPLSTMKNLLRKFIEMVAGLRLRYGADKSPLVIWKTTTFPYLEEFKPKPSTQLRFLTKHVSFFVKISLTRDI